MGLIDLVINATEESSGWKEFFINASANTIGGLVGVGSSLWLYYRSLKSDKAKEKEKKLENQEDKLKYFAALIESVIDTGETQVNNIKEYIEKITVDNVNFNLLSQVAIYDLKRVVESDNLEDFLIAYTEHFSGNKSAVKNFKEILSTTDYLYEQFNQLPLWLKNCQDFDYKKKERLKKVFDECHATLIHLVNQYIENNVPEAEAMQEIYKQYRETSISNLDLKHRYEFFFIPYINLGNEFTKYNGPVFINYLNFLNMLREGASIFEHMQYENDRLCQELKELVEDVEIQISELTKPSKAPLTVLSNH